MGVFTAIGGDAHEEVLFGVDPVSGLKCIIAVHSTALGPALGGTRFFPYPDEESALEDAPSAIELADERIAAVGTLGLRRRGGKRVR